MIKIKDEEIKIATGTLVKDTYYKKYIYIISENPEQVKQHILNCQKEQEELQKYNWSSVEELLADRISWIKKEDIATHENQQLRTTLKMQVEHTENMINVFNNNQEKNILLAIKKRLVDELDVSKKEYLEGKYGASRYEYLQIKIHLLDSILTGDFNSD